MSKNKSLSIAAKIRKMKVGDQFIAADKPERESALRHAKTLREAGVIDFQIVTRQQEGSFVVVAI